MKPHKSSRPNQECNHKRIKRNYPHGIKSGAFMVCKDCGEVVTPYKLQQIKRNTKRKRR